MKLKANKRNKSKKRNPKIGEILERLIRSRSHANIAEVGVLRGGTTFYLLDNLKGIENYYAIDRWELYDDFKKIMKKGRFKSCNTGFDFDAMYRNIVAKGKMYKNKLHVMRMDSEEAAKKIPDGSLDMVFIDANHAYEYVKKDIIAWLPKVKVGGILAGHDYGKKGPEGNFGVTEAVNELITGVKLLDRSIWYKEIK